jgi:hypothetical protein
MKTPFTTEEFFSVFENYNSTVFPAQIVLLLLGIFALYMVITQKKRMDRTVGSLLSLFWIWMGAVYHIIFFSPINTAAKIFGALFILQGIFFLIETYQRKKLEFSYSGNLKENLGLIFILFGLVIYPVISYFLSGSVEKTISFGLPCPTTIATFGFYLMATKKFSKYLLIIPSLWALIGTTAALRFGVYQDFLLIVTAIVANVYIFKK